MTATFLISGTPLNRLSIFRPLLERADMSLTDSSEMAAKYIPHIEAREFIKLNGEIKDSFVGIAFDGTSRLGEAINLTGRLCSKDFVLATRLLRYVTAKKHLNAAQFASLLTRILCVEYSIDPDMVVSISRDSVNVNGAACARLQEATFLCSENMLCISHTLNNVGGKLVLPTLQEFFTPWLELVGGRNPHRGAHSLWKRTVHPQVVPGYSYTRWHASAEIQFVLADNFHQLHPFVCKLDELSFGDATRKKLGTILRSDEKASELALQLAAVKDLRSLVSTTYELEGDRLELLLVYNRVEALRSLGRGIIAGADGLLPNVDLVLRRKVKMQPGIKIEKVNHSLTPTSPYLSSLTRVPTMVTALRWAWKVCGESDILAYGGLHALPRHKVQGMEGEVRGGQPRAGVRGGRDPSTPSRSSFARAQVFDF